MYAVSPAAAHSPEKRKRPLAGPSLLALNVRDSRRSFRGKSKADGNELGCDSQPVLASYRRAAPDQGWRQSGAAVMVAGSRRHFAVRWFAARATGGICDVYRQGPS